MLYDRFSTISVKASAICFSDIRIQWLFFFICAICLLCPWHALSAERIRIPSHPSLIHYDSLSWETPTGSPYRTQLKNGLRVYIGPDHSLPLISMTAYIRTGSLNDPPQKTGLAALVSHLMRTAGTQKIPASQIDNIIEQFALSINFSMGESQLMIQAKFLSQFADTALAILEQVLFHPAFEQSRIDQEKSIIIQNIEHRFDNPEPILAAAYAKTLYPDEANSALSTKKSISAITRKDCISFHNQVFAIPNIILAVAGDLDKEAFMKKLEKMFASIAQSSTPVTFPSIAAKPSSKIKTTIVHKNISQAYVRIGLPLFRRPNIDYYPLSLFNLILGGDGFTSRLSTKIRSDEGLTYSIASAAESNYTYQGTFFIQFFTNYPSVNKALQIILAEVTAALTSAPATPEEILNAKKNLIDELPSMFRNKNDIVSTYAWNEYYNRSDEHFKLYPDSIRAVTSQAIIETSRKYIKPNDFIFVVVGDTAQLRQSPEYNGFSLYKPGVQVLTPQQLYEPAAVSKQ
ncbi:MAG: insulinase family protein [Chitinivibrionales bacterium]|nr:insulinase family protein [Chitinivibrionales bacterium]